MKQSNINALLQGYTLRKPDNSAKVWLSDTGLEFSPPDLPMGALNDTDWQHEDPAATTPEQTMRRNLDRLMEGQYDPDREFKAQDVSSLMVLLTGLATMLQHRGLTVPFLAGYVFPRHLFDAAHGKTSEESGDVVVIRTTNLDKLVAQESLPQFASDLLTALGNLKWSEDESSGDKTSTTETPIV